MNSETNVLLTWNRLQQDLKEFVYRKVKDKAISDDIVQDVFLKVQANLPQLKDSKKLSSWIYQITRNVVVDHFRKNIGKVKTIDINWENAQNELNDCVAHCLRVLLDRLPEKYSLALKLTEFENLSQYELAERLNISYSGARSRVQRARKMLKEKIDALYLIKTDVYGNVIVCEDRSSCCCKREC